MSFRSIVVSLEVDSFAPATIKAAGALAHRFDAALIGIAAAEPSHAIVAIDGAGVDAAAYAAERDDIEAHLRSLEEGFRALLPAGLRAEWRAYVEPPTRSLVSAARCADLIVLGADAGRGPFARSVDPGELVVAAGRPVLTLGSEVTDVRAERVVIGWKDTREARRAVSDALPFLSGAREVLAVTVGEGHVEREQASLDDLLVWLERHGITARAETVDAPENPAAALGAAAAAHGADLVVSGGYGHSRTREWLFGGMTRDLISMPAITRLMSN